MVYGDPKEIWLNCASYNMARVFNRIADQIEQRGGKVNRFGEEMLIHTRGFVAKIETLQNLIDAAKFHLKNPETLPDREKTEKAVAELEAELLEVKKEERDAPMVKTTFASRLSGLSINFELDGFRYSYHSDRNPYFPDNAFKAPADESDYGYYSESIENKPWLLDELFKPVADKESIEISAAVLLDFLLKLPISKQAEHIRRQSRLNKKGARK